MAVDPLSAGLNLAEKLTDVWKGKTDRRKARDELKATAKLAKQNNDAKRELTDAEWEALSKEGEDRTWKDEYVTIVITSPIVMLILGSIWGTLTGKWEMVYGVQNALHELDKAGVDMAFLMNATVLAALGLKVWRKL